MPLDLVYALRQIRKSRGVALAITATLALCLGANAVIFSVIYAVVLKPLPFPDSGRLIEVYNSYPKSNIPQFEGNLTQYLDYAAHPELAAGAALYSPTSKTMGDASGPVRTSAIRVTPGYLAVLGLQPALGQFFSPEMSRPANSRFVVLAHSFWQAHFNSDPGVLGRKLVLDDEPCIVIGVAPPAAAFFSPTAAIFVPMTWTPQSVGGLDRHTKSNSSIGHLLLRLPPGLTLDQARTRVAAVDRGFYDGAAADYRRFVERTGYRSVVTTVRAEEGGPQKGTLYLLQAATLFVLLIGCLNLASLLLGRGLARRSEIAIRHALGARRWELARQLLVESTLFSLGGGAAGIGLAVGGLGLFQHFGGGLLPAGTRLTLEWPMLAFALALSLLVGLLAGLFPALVVTRRNLLRGIQQSSRSFSAGRSARIGGAALASGQVALSLALLAGAGLLMRSLERALAVPPGIQIDGITTARVAIPSKWMHDPAGVLRLQQGILDALRQIPGVESAALATNTPMSTTFLVAPAILRGEGDSPAAARPLVYYFSVSPGYFSTLAVPLLGGRLFDARDDAPGAPRSAIVDRRFAERLFPGQNPIGRKIALEDVPASEDQWLTIVGVVETARYTGLDDANEYPFVYLPIGRVPNLGNSYFIRSRRPAREIVPVLRERILSVNRNLPVYNTGSLEEFVSNTLAGRRSVLVLLGIFVAIALLLSSIGIYSVLAYEVSLRTREIGIRAAIGASRAMLLGMFLRQGLAKIGTGIALGLAGALYLGKLMAGLLFAVSPWDPPTLAAAAFVLLGFGLAASLFPALRAARTDPIITLRAE